jgi:hypothetical protein
MKIFLLVVMLFVGGLLHSQVITDSTNVKRANVLFDSKEYKKAKRIYEKEAFKYSSPTLLHQAALCYEEITSLDYCTYYKEMVDKGFKLQDSELFFYQCDPKTFTKLKIEKAK